MASSFVLKQTENGEICFNFLNKDGEILLMSGNYDDKAQAEAAIKEVRVNSLMSQNLAAGKTDSGEQFFVIKGNDGNVLVKSSLYTSQMVMDNALHCVKDNACIAEISDMTA
jgi:uncharacterized protein YegP (UPF0339 family)